MKIFIYTLIIYKYRNINKDLSHLKIKYICTFTQNMQYTVYCCSSLIEIKIIQLQLQRKENIFLKTYVKKNWVLWYVYVP